MAFAEDPSTRSYPFALPYLDRPLGSFRRGRDPHQPQLLSPGGNYPGVSEARRPERSVQPAQPQLIP